MFYTVDRIEGNFAVLEDDDDNFININLNDLPENIKEGDILRFYAENNIYIVDKEKTFQANALLKERFRRLIKRKK